MECMLKVARVVPSPINALYAISLEVIAIRKPAPLQRIRTGKGFQGLIILVDFSDDFDVFDISTIASWDID